MGDSSKSGGKFDIAAFYKGVKAELKKIAWPGKDDLLKQSIAVTAISIAVGAIIAVLDFALQYGVDFLTTLKF